ncbi:MULTISPECIES: PAS domain-containing sensor histidine kinase [Arenibacter]|uniref:PAS domain-containing sensor histidine kinase n=1 Tax=Arenibacter TaxID=178469 RepID=UPI0018654CD7|nr:MULTISPECIES: PAS domain-containing sensor histidine kinase [Arenibacter]
MERAISEAHNVSEALKSSLERVSDGVVVFDKDFNYTYINPAGAQLLGRTIEDLIGKNYYKEYPEAHNTLFARAYKKAMETQEPIYIEEHYEAWGKWFTNKIYPSNEGITIFFNDITESKNNEILLTNLNAELIIAKEKAEDSDLLKSAFLANMSHEIRTPMNGILGFSSLLKEPNLSGESQQEYVAMIEKSGARMLNIIQEIIDISRIEAGQIKVNFEEVNVNGIIEYVYKLLKLDSEQKGLQLSFKNSLPDTEVRIKTDNGKLHGILTNLVKNAIKYTDYGSVEFGYNIKGDFIEFYVNDSGIGIPKDKQKAIFERFMQADIRDIEARQGVGLGLAIAKAYIEMLGGSIWLESDEGKGTTFYFTILYHPVYEPETIVGNDSPTLNEGNLSEGLKILVAEDDAISQHLICHFIKKFTKEVVVVSSGLEAVEACKKNTDFDLVLMDIQMPNMNGLEATQQIRKFNNHLVIIAQSAFAMTGDKEKAIELGCNDYISKPINKPELLALIEKHFK